MQISEQSGLGMEVMKANDGMKVIPRRIKQPPHMAEIRRRRDSLK